MKLSFVPEQIELLPLSAISAYPKNPRKHPPEQIEKIAASMRTFGWTMPILVDANNEVIAGHGRLLAAERVGLEQIPAIRIEHLSPTEIRACRLADNQLTIAGKWDNELLSFEIHDLNSEGFDLDILGFDTPTLDELLSPLDDGKDLDETPEPPINPVSRPGDLWLLDDHRLLCGDSTKADDVIRVMHNQKAILFASDPPYLVDYTGTNHPSKQGWPDKNKDWSESYAITWDDASQGPELYEGFIKAAIAHAILPNAAWYCWHASRRQAMVEGVWEKFGAFVHQQIVWAKDRGILTRSYYLWQHEPCFFGWLRGNEPPRVADDYPSTIWNIPTVELGERTEHPTSKPVEVFALPMRQHTKHGEVCYEPFAGSGSQIIAGEATGRRVYAIEISPQYVDMAVKRWQTVSDKQAVLDGDGRTFDEISAERLCQAEE